ncbi:MAG: DUF262 domain-containing protein [Candidatus Competibacteraceae bacterium]|nr:DUF262 domain-containing protein [Candidatus Competibacteraceae bacterium]
MQALENRLRQLLDSTQQYIIPLFQRFYVWEAKYWETLWSDLSELIEDDDPQRSHFLGSIVVIPATDSAPSLPKFIIIDGQQRLATLLVMLSTLRDHARQAGDTELAAEIEQRFLINQFKHGDDACKLLLSQSDRIAFQHLIQAKTPHPNHSLCQCYDFYAKKLNRPDAPALRALLSAIVDRLAVVTITLAANDNPYLVFESLNFKGHKLTEADLIRNYLFMGIPSDEQEARYAQYWTPMQEALNERLTDFVRHYLMRNGAFVKQSEVYVTLKNRVLLADTTTALKELATFARDYAKLLDPVQEPHPLIRAGLTRLNRLEVTTVYPFLLNVYRDSAQQALSAPAFVDVLKTLENYLIRRFVCGLATNQLNKIFPTLYAQTQAQNTGDFVQALQYTLQGKGYPNDAQFRAKLPEVKLYGHGQLEKKGRFLLETLETHAHKEQIIHLDSLTLEHIMPQTLTAEWRAHLGEEAQTTHDLFNGYFIETNLGAASIHRFCQRAVAALNLPPEVWTVKVKPLGASAG